jgi:hypothetical protein
MMSGLRKTDQPLFGYRADPKSDFDRSDHAAFYSNQGDAIDSIGYPQYTGEQAGISGLGDAFSDIGGHNSFAEHMGVRSAGDTSSGQRYQELATRADELRTEIHNLKLELNWQLKLKSNAMRNDPEWLMAKHQWIYKGDLSGLDKIMARREAEEQRQFQAKENELNRQQTAEIAKLNKEKEQADKKAADVRSARFARDLLTETLKDYEAVKGDAAKTIDAGRNLLKVYQDFKEKAEIAGMSPQELFSENPSMIQTIENAIAGARSTQTAEIDKNNAKKKAEKRIEEDLKAIPANGITKIKDAKAIAAELKKKHGVNFKVEKLQGGGYTVKRG